MRKLFYVAPVLLLAVMLLVGAGCEVTTTDTTNTETTTTNTTTETTTTTDGFWSSATDQGSIADTDAAGTLNDEAFTVAHVQINNWGDYYSWTFTNTEPDSDCGVIVDDSAVNFSSKELQLGTFSATKEEVDFDDYSAYYHYEQESGTPMSINEDWTATLVVTELNESLGVVSGYVDLAFDDGTEISGAFEAELCEF